MTQLPVSWTHLGLAKGGRRRPCSAFYPQCLTSCLIYSKRSTQLPVQLSAVCLPWSILFWEKGKCILSVPGNPRLPAPAHPAGSEGVPAGGVGGGPACAPAPGRAHVGLPWERSLCPFTVCALPLLSKSLSWFSHFCKRKSHKFFLLQVSFGSRICSGKDEELFYPSLLLLFSS